MLTVWKPDATGPDGRIEGIEGDQLDESKLEDLPDGGRIIQGVEFDRYNDRIAYWLFDRHPGGLALLSNYQSRRCRPSTSTMSSSGPASARPAACQLAAAVALDAKDIGDIEDAVRMQQKVQACVGLFITPGDDQEVSTLSADGQQTGEQRNGRLEETITPGMIYRGRKGETATPSRRRRPAARSTSSASSWRPFRRRWRPITG
jgi:capsid protein